MLNLRKNSTKGLLQAVSMHSAKQHDLGSATFSTLLLSQASVEELEANAITNAISPRTTSPRPHCLIIHHVNISAQSAAVLFFAPDLQAVRNHCPDAAHHPPVGFFYFHPNPIQKSSPGFSQVAAGASFIDPKASQIWNGRMKEALRRCRMGTMHSAKLHPTSGAINAPRWWTPTPCDTIALVVSKCKRIDMFQLCLIQTAQHYQRSTNFEQTPQRQSFRKEHAVLKLASERPPLPKSGRKNTMCGILRSTRICPDAVEFCWHTYVFIYCRSIHLFISSSIDLTTYFNVSTVVSFITLYICRSIHPSIYSQRQYDCWVSISRSGNGAASDCGAGTLEPWNPGTMEPCNSQTLEPWNLGTLEPCNPGTLEPWNLETLEPWNSAATKGLIFNAANRVRNHHLFNSRALQSQ